MQAGQSRVESARFSVRRSFLYHHFPRVHQMSQCFKHALWILSPLRFLRAGAMCHTTVAPLTDKGASAPGSYVVRLARELYAKVGCHRPTTFRLIHSAASSQASAQTMSAQKIAAPIPRYIIVRSPATFQPHYRSSRRYGWKRKSPHLVSAEPDVPARPLRRQGLAWPRFRGGSQVGKS